MLHLLASIICCYVDAGLANRLRVLAAYMWIATTTYSNAHLVFIWDVNAACPGHYLELFQPIANVIFASNTSRHIFADNALAAFEHNTFGFGWIMRTHNIPKNRYGFPTWGEIENKMYSKFIPQPRITSIVNSYVQQYNICTSAAMHVRATDLQMHLIRDGKKPVSIIPYHRFVDHRPDAQAVYLLTDCPSTQAQLLEKYGSSKILVYSRMNQPFSVNSNNTSAVITSTAINTVATTATATTADTNNANTATTNISFPEERRYTTLEHTLIDTLIAAHVPYRDFKGAPYSSLSELVSRLSHLGRQQLMWCS
jgi:hypothetical protein